MSEAMIITRDPARPTEIVGELAAATDADVAAAASAARRAGPAWADGVLGRATGLTALAGRLEAGRHELATLIAREVGKPISEALAEVDRATAIVRF